VRTPVALVLSLLLIPALGLAGAGPAQAQYPGAAPVPIWGIVLGTVVVAGLLYLMVHGPDGGYYRYPYYGEYYRHYYHREYRPYVGYYPAASPLVTAAPVVAGRVLGVVVIDNHQYILSRDAGGHLSRYPYYGPYRQVYYRPEYREYRGPYVGNGAYRSAPVRQGDPRWDNDRRNLAPAYQQPHVGGRPPYQPDRPQSNVGQPPRQPYPRQDDRPNNSGSHKPDRQCGHPGEPACPNDQHR
jgi:hypothetical protein